MLPLVDGEGHEMANVQVVWLWSFSADEEHCEHTIMVYGADTVTGIIMDVKDFPTSHHSQCQKYQ